MDPRPPKRRAVLWMTLGVIAVCGVCGVVAVSRFTTTGADPGGDTARGSDGPPAMPGIGAPARDGQLEFTVRSVKCGNSQVGEVVQKTAAGQYCIVDLEVKNVGDQPQSFYNTNQDAHSPDGNLYEPDWEATYDALNGDQKVDEAINPGNEIEAIMVYDIPKDATIQTLTLHDSALSNGVTIKVS
jgi:hypothetical protein